MSWLVDLWLALSRFSSLPAIVPVLLVGAGILLAVFIIAIGKDLRWKYRILIAEAKVVYATIFDLILLVEIALYFNAITTMWVGLLAVIIILAGFWLFRQVRIRRYPCAVGKRVLRIQPWIMLTWMTLLLVLISTAVTVQVSYLVMGWPGWLIAITQTSLWLCLVTFGLLNIIVIVKDVYKPFNYIALDWSNQVVPIFLTALVAMVLSIVVGLLLATSWMKFVLAGVIVLTGIIFIVVQISKLLILRKRQVKEAGWQAEMEKRSAVEDQRNKEKQEEKLDLVYQCLKFRPDIQGVVTGLQVDFLNVVGELRRCSVCCFTKYVFPELDAPKAWLVTVETSETTYCFLGWRGNMLWQITHWGKEVKIQDFTGEEQYLEFPDEQFPTSEAKIVEVLRFVGQYSSAEVFWMVQSNAAALKQIEASKAEVRSAHLKGAKVLLEQSYKEMKQRYSLAQLHDNDLTDTKK